MTITLDAQTASIVGTVYADERRYDLLGEPAADGLTTLTTTWEEERRLPPVPVKPGDGGIRLLYIKNSYIRVFADTSFRNYASNWATRITNAFNEQHAMWDNQPEIHQYVVGFHAVNWAFSTNCGAHLDSFEAEIQSGQTAGIYAASDDAYQLFTGINMNALGCANSPTPPSISSYTASSVLVAVDHDVLSNHYDPDESQNLGIVSATELGHVYGEESHPTNTRCEWYWPWGACGQTTSNVMSAGIAMDDRGFWFTSGSSTASENRIEAEAWPQL